MCKGAARDHAFVTALIDALMQTDAAAAIEAGHFHTLRKARDAGQKPRAQAVCNEG